METTTDPGADKRREARLRRAAAAMGLALRKSRTRDPDRMDFGLYHIVDARTGRIVAGTYPFSHSLSLDDVEDVLEELSTSPPHE